tara:strand:+ start:9865 stop:11967 length:2103 start_codon:yes stop_codon:yes gene_type:complete
MIEYFKYTTGGSFTLSGTDYSGFVNVRDGVAYAGKTFSSNSKILQSTDTFFANCILNKLEFDRTVTPVNEADVLTAPVISPRSVIDQSFIDTNLGILNQNNLNLYALNIISQTNLLNFKNSAKDGNAYFLGLSSGKNDIRNDDTKMAKDNLFPIQIDPFSFIDKVPGVNVLDDTIDSTLFVYNDETFFYFTTTDTSAHTFSGSFVKNSNFIPITTDDDTGETLFKGASRFTYDTSTDTLYSISAAPSEIQLNLYDNSFVNPCGKLKLVDRIILEEEVIDEAVKIGNNLLGYRYNETIPLGAPRPGVDMADLPPVRGLRNFEGILSDDVIDTFTDKTETISYIAIRNKYSNKLIKTISTIEENERIISFDIRDTDDSILILTEPAEGALTVNPTDDIFKTPGDGGSASVTGNSDIYLLYQLDAENLTNLGPELNPKALRRYRPTYDFAAEETDVEIYFSQNDSNIFVLNDMGFISTRFISNPAEVAGFADSDNLLYLPDMYFNTTGERFNLIQKKFNSNILRSNYFNYINYIVAKNEKDLFFLLHAIGRIYLFKESNLLYQNFVPLDLKNLYEKVISCESSLGISLNSEIQNIIKDTVSIFLNLSLIPSLGVANGIPVLRDYITYKGLDINFRDMEFHENEAADYNVVSRVINQLFELQQQVLDSITEDIEDPEEEDFAGTIVIGDAEFEELNINEGEAAP